MSIMLYLLKQRIGFRMKKVANLKSTFVKALHNKKSDAYLIYLLGDSIGILTDPKYLRSHHD